MQRISILLIAFAAFFSCKKETTPPRLRLQVSNLVFSVHPGMQPPATFYLPINGVMTNALNVLAANGIDTSTIQSIRPSRGSFSIVFQEDKFDFLDAVSVRLCKLEDGGTNCGREVFYRDPVPINAGYDLDLIPSNVDDVRELVLQEELNVQVKFERLRTGPDAIYDIRLDMEFEVR